MGLKLLLAYIFREGGQENGAADLM